MKIEEVYKIADSKGSYTASNIEATISNVQEVLDLPTFTQHTEHSNMSGYKVALVFPIFNEGNRLKHTVKTHLNSYFDNTFNYSFFYFLNGCTDNSERVLLELLGKYMELSKKEFNRAELKSLGDSGLDKQYKSGEINGNQFYILNTKTKGRVNVFKSIGRYVKEMGGNVLVSFDTDIFLEPQTIYRVSNYSQAKVDDGLNVVAASGHVIMVRRRHKSFLEKWFRNHGAWFDQSYTSLSGCNMVLNINWMLENIVDVAIEDYALGLKARIQGYLVEKIECARMWGYRTDTSDDIKQLARSIRGRLQLIDLDPIFRPFIENDHFFMRPMKDRVAIISREIIKNPSNVLKLLWRFIFVETAIRRARKMFRKDPNNSDWEQLESGR